MKLYKFQKWIFFLILFLSCISNEKIRAQTAFTAPVITTQTGASNSYNGIVLGPETVGAGCAEMGQTWTHNFNGTSDKRLTGFTITSLNYYVSNFGALSTVMRRNNSSGTVNPVLLPAAGGSCSPSTAVPWNDRQISFFEGTVNTATNVASIVNSFPTTTLPGTAGYNTVNEMNLVFSRGFINSGADNIFNNNNGTGTPTLWNSNANNIERMDLFVTGGVNVTAANMNRTGIVIVCRGPADDPFVLSAIKGLTGGVNIGGGTNFVYDNIIKVNNLWNSKTINGGGAIAIGAAQRVNLITGITSVVLRRMDSTTALDDQLPIASYPTASSTVAAQNIVAMFFTFADLGLAAGETFYGYSISGYDVPAVTSDQFNSYLNGTYFPLNTDPANGGVDLTGFPGLFSPVDIDDDDDGLPDYLEANLTLTFGDADSDGILNYCDATYAPFVDNNTDGINDNFDPSADSDNDGIQNYRDNGFIVWGAFIDANTDGVNDRFDWDLDGIPNHLDKDSDNDGIPDVVESFGVDANGDGIIDNYTDTDVDGLSQNVDANSTGAISSGTGLGAIDTDADGIPNYFDHDSDNDGLPDVVEAYGTDAANDGRMDSYTDIDVDGYSDNIDGDVGNDNFSENSSGSLLRSGSDGNNDGRADSYPYKNMDADTKANPYDMDSDRDGILDVIEAGFTDANYDGKIDGAFNSKGWSVIVDALISINLPNTDGSGSVNVYDIDSDDDGIPDNVEGMTTDGYLLPAGSDSDGDGLDNSYDNFIGFGGNGINPVDKDGDTIPDYLDSDTDGDGVSDIIEGNDFNFNGQQDDDVTLTGTDTDGDGLDDHFDNDNSSAKGTSAYMGNGGTTSGDSPPGSITTVQHSGMSSLYGCPTERDWRCVSYLLRCETITFKVKAQLPTVYLEWDVFCNQEVDYFTVERSIDGVMFSGGETIIGKRTVNETESYASTDVISGISAKFIYYRLKMVNRTGRIRYSQVISITLNSESIKQLIISPNPVRDHIQISIQSEKQIKAEIIISDNYGKTLYRTSQNLVKGINNFGYTEIKNWQAGTYFIRVNNGEATLARQFILLK